MNRATHERDGTAFALLGDPCIRGKITLAVGNPYHSSLTRLSPSEMVDEVIENILKLNTGARPETAKDL